MSKKDKKPPEMLVIRNKYQLWDDFIVEGQKNRWPNRLIKARLLEAIRKEVFDQMCWRMKVGDVTDAPHTPENERIVESITRETKKKWQALIRMCDEHLYTHGMLSEKDLEGLFSDGESEEDNEDGGYEFIEAEDPEEESEEWDGDETTAEWPELSEVQPEEIAQFHENEEPQTAE